jgi:ABC-type glycerol-3-phosphate transport system substrate-binding protein
MQDAGPKMPDVIHDDTFMMEAYKESGLIQPIDDLLEQWEEEDPDSYNLLLPVVWEETTFDGERYGMSATANFDIFYYNIPWFEEAGVELPLESWDDVFTAMEQMKETRPDGVPLTVQALAGEGVTTLKTVLAGVGTPFDGATPDLHSDGAQYALDWFIRAQEAGLLPEEAISCGESEARGAFIRGDAGLIVDGITTAGDFNEVPDFAFDEQWGTSPLPAESGTGLEGNYITQARTWAITSDVEHRYEASLVLRYLGSTDQLIEPLGNGSVPMRQTEALEDPRFDELLPFFGDELKEAYLAASPGPAGLNGGEVEAVLEQLFGEIVTGSGLSAEELADKYQPQLDAL